MHLKRRISVITAIIFVMLIAFFPNMAHAQSNQPDSNETALQGVASATTRNAINVRSGPDSGFWVVGVLAANETVPILGVNASGTWWLINTGFTQGWVADSVVTTSNTTGVPVQSVGESIVVTTGELNVRTGPGIGASTIGLAVNGSRLFVIGRSNDGAWLNVRTQFGTGWVATEFTSGSNGGVATTATVTADPAIAIVEAQTLNVRSGPGVNFSVIGVVEGGDQLPIVGSSADRQWFNVQTPFGPGWVSDLYVLTRNEFGSAPVTTNTVDPTAVAGPIAVVNAFQLNVRSGPDATFTIIDTVSGGEQFQILARNETFTWVLIDNGDVDGWVRRLYVIIRGDTTNLQVATAQTAATVTDPNTGETTDVVPATPGPVAFVASGALNVRSGPNVAFEPLGFVFAATRMPIIGQSADGDWWQVESPLGVGWVTKRLIIVENSALNVPVVQ